MVPIVSSLANIVSSINALEKGLLTPNSLFPKEALSLVVVYKKTIEKLDCRALNTTKNHEFLVEVENLRKNLKKRVKNLENQVIHLAYHCIFSLENKILSGSDMKNEEMEDVCRIYKKIKEYSSANFFAGIGDGSLNQNFKIKIQDLEPSLRLRILSKLCSLEYLSSQTYLSKEQIFDLKNEFFSLKVQVSLLGSKDILQRFASIEKKLYYYCVGFFCFFNETLSQNLLMPKKKFDELCSFLNFAEEVFQTCNSEICEEEKKQHLTDLEECIRLKESKGF